MGAFLAGLMGVRPPPTVATLDLQRYAGRWYQQGHLPSWFQPAGAQCAVTADYEYVDSVPELGGRPALRVVNRSRRIADGQQLEITGWAYQQSPADGGRLLVQFTPSASQPRAVPGPQPYWVLQLAADYRYAVVSSPDRRMLWILAREPPLSQDDMRAILHRLIAEHGFSGDTLERIEWTPWPPVAAGAAVTPQ